MEDVLLIGLLIAGIALGYLAWKGKLSFGWAAGALGAALALLGWRRGGRRDPYAPPPAGRPGADVANPILLELNGRTEEERARIREANEDPDELERLKRLAALNDGGRE